MAVSIYMTVFWDVVPCSMVDVSEVLTVIAQKMEILNILVFERKWKDKKF
jgi:hypothetical protein